jgi:hypothetical protein
MASTRGRPVWKQNTKAFAALLALDVCGFSEDTQPDQLLAHRGALFHAVDEAPIVLGLVRDRLVKVQFVGDELRFAFHGTIPQRARKVHNFVDAIFENLRLSGDKTRVKGVVLSGVVTWRVFYDCDFFDGTCAVSCSDWLSCVRENQVIVNEAFRNELNSDGVATSSFQSVTLLARLDSCFPVRES